MKQFNISLLLLLLFAGHIAKAQSVAGAGIAGHIRTAANTGISHASIDIKNESTGFHTATITNEKGDFLFKELPLGGPYNVHVSSVGFTEQTQTGFMLNQGDLVRVDFTLIDTATELQSVKVVSSTLKSRVREIGASTSVSSRAIAKLPVNGRNFTSLIDLSPLSRGGNLSGQLASATNYTIDGMAARGTISGGQPSGAYSISMEAIREFQIVTNQYDVTYGMAGGGTVSTVTKSGTNTLSGSAFTFARTNWLSSPYDLKGSKRNQQFSTYQYGFSLGGPIIKNKMHFFMAWDHQADSRPLYIADVRSAADEKIFNVTRTTLDRYQSIAQAKYGVANSPQFGQFAKPKSTDAGFLRLDWQLNSRNLLTIRDNFVYDMDHESDGDNTAINAYESYASRKSWNNSVMASLRTVLNPKLTNELKVQHYIEWNKLIANSQLPADNIPRAIVQNIESKAADGATLSTAIQIGGQRYGGDFFRNNVWQLNDNLFYNINNLHFTFGGGVTYTNQYSVYGSEINGRFYFTGLNNFDSLRPYRYARDIYTSPDMHVGMNILAPNVYAQLQTSLFPGFDITGGVRVDYADYLTKANFSQTVYNELGLNTSNKLASLQIQPRVQATWDINKKGKNIVRVGGGILGSALNPYAMINNMLFDGSHIVSVDITGANVPTPNFPAYRQNPASAPGVDLFKNPGIQQLITINMNGKDAKVPVVYKTNASFTHFFSDRLRLTVTGYLTYGRNNYMYVDRNMLDQPYFRIEAEDNRGVYVPASTIGSNGAADWTKGRKSDKVGRVLELISDSKVNQKAIVIDGDYRYWKDGQVAFSYTLNDSKDNTSYNGNVANTATLSLMVKDDPRDLSKTAYSDNQFRHKVVFYGTAPSFWGISAGLRFSGISGTRYSMIVNGNVNGDFVASNDLAYIYDPNNAATPQYLKDGINAILNNPNVEEGAKKYIRNSFGKVAQRNGGVNPFYSTLDLRLSKRIKFGKKTYIEPSVELFNVTNLINKTWGVNHNLGNTNIYTIRGFNQTTKTYTYSVNTNAGVSSLSGNPYQFQIGARVGF